MERDAATWRHRLISGTVFALPVAILSMGGMLPGLENIMRGPLVVGALPLGWLVQAVLAAVVQVRGFSPAACGVCWGLGFLFPHPFCRLFRS